MIEPPLDGSSLAGAVVREAPRTAHVLLWGAAILFIVALLMKMIGVGLMEFEGPMGGNLYLIRTLLTLVMSGLFVSGIVIMNPSRRQLTAKLSSQSSAWTVVMLSAFFALVLALDPGTYIDWAYEDGLVETMSATFSIMASLVFVLIFIELWRARARPRSVYLGGAAAMALLLFAVGMEEISWMQRVLSVDTPAALAANLQGEINLHNFDTLIMNIVFYTVAFLLLILVPFLDDQTSLFKKAGPVRFFIPGLTVLLISSISVFYNYKLWDTLFLQLWLFVTMFILAYYAVYARGSFRLLIMALMASGIATQLLFFNQGHNFGLYWLGSEYREFFIPIGFLIYSLELLRRARWLRQN